MPRTKVVYKKRLSGLKKKMFLLLWQKNGKLDCSFFSSDAIVEEVSKRFGRTILKNSSFWKYVRNSRIGAKFFYHSRCHIAFLRQS
jgi:hypothetical protein